MQPAMNDSIFAEKEFFLLIVVSIILPVSLYAFMMMKQSLSRAKVMLLGVTMVLISGGNVVLLQRLAAMAKVSPSLLDNRVFSSEISLALYLVPALFAGIGINIISHVIVRHLEDAEQQFDRLQREKKALVAVTPRQRPASGRHPPQPGATPMPSASSSTFLLRAAYAAFNARDIDAALALMTPDVAWPRAFKGGFVVGHDAVRAYWTEQWGEIDPHVEPVAFQQDAAQVLVEVRQVVRDLAGAVLADEHVRHRFTIAGGLIQQMEVAPLAA
jgi:hypothetical protein